MAYKGYKVNILFGRGKKMDPWDRDCPSVCNRKAKKGIRRMVRCRLKSGAIREELKETEGAAEDHMIITIDVYKDTGKWYTGETVEGPDINLWDDIFKPFIWDHLPAKIGNGYIVVKDTGNGSGFHNRILPYEELKRCPNVLY